MVQLVDDEGLRLRSDAQRNRDHILRVAHDAFAESATMSLSEITKRAGVGPGTLYRHFPSREALLLAVHRPDIEHLVDSIPDLLRTQHPLDAFRHWFETLADYICVKHGLGDALHTAAVQGVINQTYAQVAAAVGQLIDALVAEGTFRPGLDPADVLLLMDFLWRIGEGPEVDERKERLLDLVIEGLRVR